MDPRHHQSPLVPLPARTLSGYSQNSNDGIAPMTRQDIRRPLRPATAGNHSPTRELSPTSLTRAVPLTATQANSRGMFCRNGELFAIAHAMPHARPHSAAMTSHALSVTRSSYRHQYSNANPDPNAKKLMPYKPDCLRNMLPVQFPSANVRANCTTGPGKKNLLSIFDMSHTAQFVSLNQRSYPSYNRPQVGFTNPGIVAGRTKWRHRRIQD